MKTKLRLFAAVCGALAFTTTIARAANPLPSWNDGAGKQSITEFVAKVTKPGSPDFVPVAECIAAFDHDGTLWAEQPMYFQLLFALHRVGVLAPQHPEWKDKEPFASLLKGDVKAALAGGERALAEIIMATHAGMTTEEFEKIVKDWIVTATHPKLLQHTQGGAGARFCLLVHHDDAAREFAYGAESHIGTFSDALMAEAKVKSWTVVSMKNDWKIIFPAANK